MDTDQRIEALLDQLMDPQLTELEMAKLETKVKILQRLKQ